MGEDDFIAAISPFAGTYAPVNYMACTGVKINVMQNQALFALIGGQYGPSDFSTYFTIPNLTNGVPVGVGPLQAQGTSAPLAKLSFTDGTPAAAGTAPPTAPVLSTGNGVSMQWCMCVNGIWPQRP